MIPNSQTVIMHARSLKGTPYDPLMGKYDNLGAKGGFIVCSDVPNIAYGLSGFSWQSILAKDYKKSPYSYDSRNGNTPGNPYFHRRARNLFSYFESVDRLMPNSYKPSIGDLVFYKKKKHNYISHVALVSEVTESVYYIIESAPRTILTQEVSHRSPIERGWVLMGYGRVN